MSANQSLAQLTATCLEKIDGVLLETQPDCVVGQGDTTSAMVASMAAFYRQIPFVHVEAGLRTGDLHSPFPEEFNRRIAGLTTTVHCAPTRRSAENLRAEGIPPNTIHVTGNPVIDALLWATRRERASQQEWQRRYAMLDGRRMVLITAHRRESFGGGMERICQAIATLAEQFKDTVFVYPVHLNPHVQDPVKQILGDHKNIHLMDPLPYPAFAWMMDRCRLILSDSGGVQEEAPSLGKPVIVMREVTERVEAVEAGAVKLVGTCVDDIVGTATQLLTDEDAYRAMQVEKNPYGDGHAATRIVDLIARATADETA